MRVLSSRSRAAWILETARAILELIGLHLAVVLLFQVILKRWPTPRILSDLIIGVGYAAILIALLTRVGVNLTGIIATSAVATAVIGFGMQDLLGNLAGGLVLEFERTILEGDWIRTDQFYGRVRSVRMRKYLEIDVDGKDVEMEARLQGLCRDLLSNPVIEDYQIEEVSE